jgi:hypothetical protein
MPYFYCCIPHVAVKLNGLVFHLRPTNLEGRRQHSNGLRGGATIHATIGLVRSGSAPVVALHTSGAVARLPGRSHRRQALRRTARAGNRRNGRLSALRAHTKAHTKWIFTGEREGTLRVLNRPSAGADSFDGDPVSGCSFVGLAPP